MWVKTDGYNLVFYQTRVGLPFKQNQHRTMGAAHLAQKIQQFESPTPITWKQYLVDGHLHEWEGEMEKVFSPMGPISAEGETQRHYLGEPQL